MSPLVVDRRSAARSRVQAHDIAPLVGDARAETSDLLRRAATIRPFVRGDVVIRQGEDLRVALVLAGFMMIARTDARGHRYSLVVLRAGQTVGLRSVTRSTSSMFDIVALSEGRVATFRGDVLRGIAAHDPDFALRILDLSTAATSLLIERLDEIEFSDSPRRLATILLAYEPLFAVSDPVISRSDLASLVGTSRETVGSVIRDLEARGAIRRTGRGIRILDREVLREVADWNGMGREHAEWLRIATADPSIDRPIPGSATGTDPEAQTPDEPSGSSGSSPRPRPSDVPPVSGGL